MTNIFIYWGSLHTNLQNWLKNFRELLYLVINNEIEILYWARYQSVQ